MIDTDKLRAAMPGYSEAVACGDMQTRLEDVVITLCDEIDRLREGRVKLTLPTVTADRMRLG